MTVAFGVRVETKCVKNIERKSSAFNIWCESPKTITNTAPLPFGVRVQKQSQTHLSTGHKSQTLT